MDAAIKVSVVMLARNHEAYIVQALDSAVAQKTSFPFEIVIGEDCSTDRTPEIIRDYAGRYPELVRPLLRDKNLGSQRNNIETIAACRGEYIAILDSDDFWTSDQKLEKQVALMDSDPEYRVGFHRANVLYESGRPAHVIPADPVPEPTIENLLQVNFIPSLSTMYRRSAMAEFPEWYTKVSTYDWPLHVLTLASGGKIAFLDDVLATYRVHSTAMWSSQTDVERLGKEIEAYRYLLPELPDRLRPYALKGLSNRWYHLASTLRKLGRKPEAKAAFKEAVALEGKDFKMPLRRKLRFHLQMLTAKSAPKEPA